MDEKSDRDAIWKYIEKNHYIKALNDTVGINPDACAVQNVSDSHHDGLNPDAARRTLPTVYDGEKDDMSEDKFLETYLYTLNKSTPNSTQVTQYLQENYECFFRIPLIHGETTNVGSTGEPQYPDRNSVLETIFDELGLANQNIYVSKDFGFPAMQYDFTYFKNRQIYIGYRPAQENDAAGKPTLTSSKAFEFGFQSPNIKVDFIWTTPEIDKGFTHLPRWTGGTVNPPENPTLNYSLLDYDTFIQWDPTKTGQSANDLKSQTFFVKPLDNTKSIVYHSNSDWTSKSGKELKAYQQFNNGAQEILKKNPLALGDLVTSANKAITATDFDEFHTLAKRSGDALTAYIKPLNNQEFIRLKTKSADISGPTTPFPLTDFAFMYQTHDRLAAAGALTRKVEMVILESPRESGGDSVFSLFIRKDMLDVGKNYKTIKETYYGSGDELSVESPYAKLMNELKNLIAIKNIDDIIQRVDPTWSYSVYDNNIVIDDSKTKIGGIITIINGALESIDNDEKLLKYIKLQMLKKAITDIEQELESLNPEHIDIGSFFGKIVHESPDKYKPLPANTDDGMKTFISNVVYPFNEYKSCMKTHKSLNALADKISKLPTSITDLIESIVSITNLNNATLTSLNKIKPNTQIYATSTKRIMSRFNPLKLFATSKDRLNILLSTDLPDSFGFPELLLKLWDKLPDDALETIYNYYHNAYKNADSLASSNPNNHDLELIAQCLGFVFSKKYNKNAVTEEDLKTHNNATTFKELLMEFAEHKDLLLTEKKTKDDFMLELPSVTLSRNKIDALQRKKKMILTKIADFTNRMLGRIIGPKIVPKIVPISGGKKTRARRGKILGKRTKKYRGGGKRVREGDVHDDSSYLKTIRNTVGTAVGTAVGTVLTKRKPDDNNDGPAKKIRSLPPPTARDIELLFRILGVFVFFLTFLRDERDKLKIKNPAIQTFCDKKIDKINAFVKKIYLDHFDILIRLFVVLKTNLKNMFHYGPGDYSNDIYKYDPNYYDQKYEKYIEEMTKPDAEVEMTNDDDITKPHVEVEMTNDDDITKPDTQIDLFNDKDGIIPLEDKIVYLFAQYIPFFIRNSEESNPDVEDEVETEAMEEVEDEVETEAIEKKLKVEYSTFEMLYDNTMASVIMYIIGTYIGDIENVFKLEINYIDEGPLADVITLEPLANVCPILGFLPAILNVDDFNKIDDSKLQAFIRRMPTSDTLPNIIKTKINTPTFDNYAIYIQQNVHKVTLNNGNTYIDTNNFKPSYNELSIYPDPNNNDIEIFKTGVSNIKNPNIKKNLPIQPPSMKTGVDFNMPYEGSFFGSLFKSPNPHIMGKVGGYKSSRKNKKYRKPRKYIYK